MTSLTYEKTVNLTWLIGVASILIMPDAVFGLLLELAHLMLEVAHLLFEIFESALDHFVEHTFHTGTRETQLIVFYTIMAMGLVSLYFLWRTMQRLFHKLKESLMSAFLRQKNRLSMYWQESATNKFKLIAGLNVALGLVVEFGF